MAAIEWLEANRRSDNWFLQVEIFDPHEPFYCTEKYRAMYGDNWEGPLFDWPNYDVVRESPEAIEHIRKCYAGLLTMSDYWVGRILDKLEELGLWDNTLIVFTTDHGTVLAEHDFWMKTYMPLYNEIARIPLIMKLPGGEKAGARVAAFSQTVDLMPTFLDFFDCPKPPHLHGRSLRASLSGGRIRADGILGYFGMATNITDGEYIYFRNPVNADGGPLHAYTSMPTAKIGWYPREVYSKVEMGRYFGHTHNLPLYKIPVKGQVPKHGPKEESHIGRHQLYDVIRDPQQLSPISSPDLEKHFVNRIMEHLFGCEAPAEQFTRLGLKISS